MKMIYGYKLDWKKDGKGGGQWVVSDLVIQINPQHAAYIEPFEHGGNNYMKAVFPDGKVLFYKEK